MEPTSRRLSPPEELMSMTVDPGTERPHTHVYVVFDDGEICVTKCGDLFGCRIFHLREVGWRGSLILDSGMETPTGNVVRFDRRLRETPHTYVAFDEEGPAYALRSWLLDAVAGPDHGIPTFRVPP